MSQITKGVSSGNLPSTVIEMITGNDGTPESGISHNFTLVTANATPKFQGSAGTETLDFGLLNLALGSSLPSLTSGGDNSYFGYGAGGSTTSGNTNTAMGFGALSSNTTGEQNTAIGTDALAELDRGMGSSGSSNVALGFDCLFGLRTGSENIGVGALAGYRYTSSESSNITIGNSGIIGESNVIRIGTQGVAAGQQTQCYLAGVLNTTSGRVVNITSPAVYPYATLISDDVIIVDTTSARTITPLTSPVKGTTYRIKDNTGNAAANNITITPSGKNIDGAASYVISSNYGSVDIVYNGTQWNVL